MRELGALECGTSLAELLSSALPSNGEPPHANGQDSECASTSSVGSAPASAPTPAPAPAPAWPPRASAFDAAVLQEVVGNALDDLSLDDPLNLMAALDRDLADAEPAPPASAPVNIPRAPLRGFSPAGGGSPLPPFLRYASDADRLFNSTGARSASFGATPFEFCSSPGSGAGAGAGGGPELTRLREEVVASRAAVARWDERIAQARTACEAWRRELDDALRKTAAAERQRDEALAHALSLRRELGGAHGEGRRELRGLPLSTLKALQAAARAELEDIEKALYLETATKCMVCEERARCVTLAPCNHLAVCEPCGAGAADCPYCRTPLRH